MDQREATLGRGVVVLGSHRSGTSAATSAIDALGLPVCRSEDRFPIRQWNARGNFESASLSVFDEHLLNFAGGRWWAPPLPRRGWAERQALNGWRLLAAQLFAAAHPTGSWVWKDPRACVLMPFWDLVLGSDTPRIVVLRHPLESAASLASRDGMGLGHGLALAERNLRTSLRDSAGRPVLVTSYDDLLLRTEDWCSTVGSFIRSNSLPLREPLAVGAVKAAISAELRHHRSEGDASNEMQMPASLVRLWTWAIDHAGAHESLSIHGLPAESPSTGRILKSALNWRRA